MTDKKYPIGGYAPGDDLWLEIIPCIVIWSSEGVSGKTMIDTLSEKFNLSRKQ